MAISLGNIFVQGVLGAAGGAAAGAAQVDQMKMKEEMERTKEERLSKLRTQEHATNRQFDLKMTQDAQAKDRKDAADFYARTADAAPGKSINEQAAATYETDAGQESVSSNVETTKLPPNARELAAYRKQEAYKTGNEKLIAQTLKEDEDLRKEDEQRRKESAEERRLKKDEATATEMRRANDIKEKEQERKDRELQGKLDGLIGGGGKKGDPNLAWNKYDDKAWQTSYDNVKKTLFKEDISGKQTPDYEAHRAAIQVMNGMRDLGMDPHQAEAVAGMTIGNATRKVDEFLKTPQAKGGPDRAELIDRAVSAELTKLKIKSPDAPATSSADSPKGVIDSKINGKYGPVPPPPEGYDSQGNPVSKPAAPKPAAPQPEPPKGPVAAAAPVPKKVGEQSGAYAKERQALMQEKENILAAVSMPNLNTDQRIALSKRLSEIQAELNKLEGN